MTTPFPSPTITAGSRTEVFVRYLDFFRARALSKVASLPEAAQRSSTLPSGWTPLELLQHLRYVELRWLAWGFEGQDVGDQWADLRDGRWYLEPGATLDQLAADLTAQGARSTAIIEAHSLDDVGKPGERWNGAEPATLERVVLHLIQEYARHLGQLDILAELADGETGE